MLQDDAVPVVKIHCFAAGEVREIPVKVLRHVYWRKAGPDLRLLLVVIKTLGYRLRKGCKPRYRQPAFLICTDPDLDLPTLLQAYLVAGRSSAIIATKSHSSVWRRGRSGTPRRSRACHNFR